MKFTVKGIVRGKEAEITWEDGKLSGDGSAVKFAEAKAYSFEK